MEAAPLIRALLLVAACRGSSSAPATGSGSSPPAKPIDAWPVRALACAPATAKVTLAVHDDQPAACWDTTCVADGERLATRPARPPAWLHPSEVRMDHGVLSACKDGCTPLRKRLAEAIAAADPARVAVSEDLLFVVVDTTVWRLRFDLELPLAPMAKHDPAEKPSRIQIAGELFVATVDGHGQITTSPACRRTARAGGSRRSRRPTSGSSRSRSSRRAVSACATGSGSPSRLPGDSADARGPRGSARAPRRRGS